MDSLYHSSDGRFGLRIAEKQMRSILRQCREANRNETGGVLVGRYTKAHDVAIVTDVPRPPGDSSAGATWFRRGVQGLQQILNRLWTRKHQFYLGEWHFHPGAAPTPSSQDISQMHEIAASENYRCPEPVLLIVGGDPAGTWTTRVFVFVGRLRVDLIEKRVSV